MLTEDRRQMTDRQTNCFYPLLRMRAHGVTSKNAGERAYLIYREDTSKNHSGGLKGHKHKQKVVIHHANTENPDRCFIRLFKLYNELCPVDHPNDSFLFGPIEEIKARLFLSHTLTDSYYHDILSCLSLPYFS